MYDFFLSSFLELCEKKPQVMDLAPTSSTTTNDADVMSNVVKNASSESSNSNSNNICYIRIGPLKSNLFRWHFTFSGPLNSPYEDGYYHGRVLLPKSYPLSPPRIQLLTPNGRFLTGTDICLSATNFHPESWTPRWTVRGLVNALRLHMCTTAGEIGGCNASEDDRRKFAERSRFWKMRLNGGASTQWCGIVDHGEMIQEGTSNDERTKLGISPSSVLKYSSSSSTMMKETSQTIQLVADGTCTAESSVSTTAAATNAVIHTSFTSNSTDSSKKALVASETTTHANFESSTNQRQSRKNKKKRRRNVVTTTMSSSSVTFTKQLHRTTDSTKTMTKQEHQTIESTSSHPTSQEMTAANTKTRVQNLQSTQSRATAIAKTNLTADHHRTTLSNKSSIIKSILLIIRSIVFTIRLHKSRVMLLAIVTLSYMFLILF
uniref:UBC core domain-containing protein n=1 Tax=Proboscia inermis TaxID=420281 RepID=A0A7S0CKE4_9STRA|mmetsp:Transcript_5995/g.6223  ORF Transcript_5995/g.6223 Transcript_5995/m.6223 type:complete len:433 (+) Transcript_5995:297-1595(+)